MAGLGQGRPGRLDGVRPGGAPARAIADPVKERHRDAMLLLRRRSQPVSRVVRYQVDDGAILWIDVAGHPRTTFIRLVGSDVEVSRPLHGFVV